MAGDPTVMARDPTVVAGEQLHAGFDHVEDCILADTHGRLLLEDELHGLLGIHACILTCSRKDHKRGALCVRYRTSTTSAKSRSKWAQ